MNALIDEVRESLLDLVGELVKVMPAVLVAIAVLALTAYGVRPITRLTEAAAQRMIENISLRLLFMQLASITTWIIGIVVAAVIAFPDLRIGDIIAFLGLGSVAVGFAFQDIFKNFLAGIILLVNEPFEINDQIVVDGYEGTIENITIRSTRLRTYQGEQVIIPNSVVFTNSVQVNTDRPYLRTDLAIGLDYNTNLAEAREVLLNAIKQAEGVLEVPAPIVDVVSFGASSIDFVVRYWTAPQKAEVNKAQSNVMIALKAACDEVDYNIPYPIRTLYFFDQDRYNDHYAIDKSSDAAAS
ncbi:MscS Mechanosensitive ion channel [Thalassoporum mexicanum PCC 7367]|uniref:mechanosensitive ion channel family protein n=1 Tax=Thalassoporum mexicanum TaxID=3457544 RepID=UPI00029FA7C2|nr:mechanosensitive ion channel family protein [Pseudanabaena sp. PCC 7367]AFY69088.1 MscS Mechanosensitive ion channel [Pseudanabaena sp. PCC 7367]